MFESNYFIPFNPTIVTTPKTTKYFQPTTKNRGKGRSR